jgi:CHRD domain
MRKVLLVAVLAVGVALAAVTVALAGGAYGGGYGDDNATSQQSTQSTSSTSAAGSETYSFTATLTGAAEVPKPKAPAGAGGTFTAKSTEGKTISFHWVLKFHGLSGKAMAAHVHLGKKGKAGPVAVPLCGPCRNGQSGTVKITKAVEEALEKGGAYVNVHTAKNAAGEVRGQVKLIGK